MTTSYPQEPADEIRAIRDELEARFARERHELKKERERLIAEGWLFETSFDLGFSTAGGADRARELLAESGYDVGPREENPRCLTVRAYLRFEEEEIERVARRIDDIVSSCSGGSEGSSTDLSRRRRPDG